jgi:hypothetical protein
VIKMRHVLFMAMLWGEAMNIEAGIAKESVYLLEFGFKWNGKDLFVGRSPIYGSEQPMDDMHPDSDPRPDEVFRCTSFPIRYPEALQENNPWVWLRFDPEISIQQGILNIHIRLVSSPESLASWFENGVDIPSAEYGEWTQRLAGPPPKKLNFEFKKRPRTFKDSGNVITETGLGTFTLDSNIPIDIETELTAMEADEERYEIVFPGLVFSWERRGNHTPLVWLKGGPARVVDSTDTNTIPVSGHPSRSKPSFWKFWKKSD